MNTSEIVSNEEMSALVPEDGGGAGGALGRSNVIPYNFRRPDRLSKDEIRSIYLLHDLFAHALSSSLPLFLKAVAEVDLISVEQQTFGEYLKGLADPTTIFTLDAKELKGSFAVEINSPIAFPVIDRMLGGIGNDLEKKRAATDLELNILEGFLGIVIDSYREAWNPITELTTEIEGRETRPQLAQMVAQNEVVVTIAYQLTIGESKGSMSFCLPITTLESVIEKFHPDTQGDEYDVDPDIKRPLFDALERVRFAIEADAKSIRIRYGDLIALTEGDILRTNHRTDAPLLISVGGNRKFKASLAANNGQRVVRVEQTV